MEKEKMYELKSKAKIQLNKLKDEMMKKKKQLIPTPIVLDNGIAGIVYGYYEGEDFYYLDRLDVDVSKKEELRKMNVMELRQEIALKIKIFVANSNWNKNF